MAHSLTFYENAEGEHWGEFECGQCGVDCDLEGNDLAIFYAGFATDRQYACPSCKVKAIVSVSGDVIKMT